MITQERLKDLLHYNKDTGIFTIKSFFGGKKTVGDVAGTTMVDGYRKIIIYGKEYRAHRLAFLYMTGEIPFIIDHINQKRDDNRWINIRPADRSINRKNTKIHKNNTSSCMGVSWSKQKNKWRAYITVNYKQISLGLYSDHEEAIKARKDAEVKYGFHKNHNKGTI